MSTPSEYPLAWPFGQPRNIRPIKSQFKTGLPGALKNTRESLQRFGKDTNKPIKNIIISSNVRLGNNSPSESGVAVYFNWAGEDVVIAVDRYTKVQCNLQAIHHIIEARRTEFRHGGLHIVKASFKGFKALPAPKDHRDWTHVLGLPRDANAAQIKSAAKKMALEHHPDRPNGSSKAMAEINAAKDQALQEITA